MSGDGVRSCGLELRNMEYRVDGSHGVRKSEGEGAGAWLGYDRVRSEVLFGQFLGGARSRDELSTDKDLISDAEFRCRKSVSVRLDLIARLSFGNVSPESGVEFLEVYGVLPGAGGGEVPLGVDGDCGVISLVRKERGNSGGRAQSIVVRELREGQESRPVVLLVVAVDSEVLLQSLVDSLGLAVAFGMVSRSEVETHVQSLSKRAEEVV